ncbi:anti-sigma factor (plasmid) [Deinococcus taeanensis]|uniref:anti-sigma factor n=1 Tax=Deinococcus taeanensis TaxID=2737050 RepID=UPI001CDD1FCD|nr:anti-sigma factor [Deinococcus taeanensis]UBV44385.1 anti-sigma factor [Deinococcus taeanensis]
MTHPTELLAGYVIGDLDVQDVRTVEAHLTGCAACCAEVGRLRDALMSLADDLPDAAVPGGTWARIQARRQAGAPDAPVARAPLRRPRRPWLWLAAALGLIFTSVLTRLAPAPSTQGSIQQWQAQGAVKLTLTGQDGQAFGLVLVRPDGQALVVLDRRAPDGQVYQAWGRRAGAAPPAAPVSLGLTDGTVLQVDWRGFSSVGVSVEPGGGSPVPTRPLGRVTLPGA